MSWFDATGFANLAKTALKEAQKTIDKALVSEPEIADSEEDNSMRQLEVQLPANTLWESLTNTLFEKTKPVIEKASSSESETSVDASYGTTQVINKQPACLSIIDNVISPHKDATVTDKLTPKLNFINTEVVLPEIHAIEENDTDDVIRRSFHGSDISDRLSGISSESDRKSINSNESVEIIGSTSTPTPDSEGDILKVKSNESSIEILSSSSIEVLNSADDFSRIITEATSSDSIEILPELSPDNEFDEHSGAGADDSCTSQSESTLTMLELPIKQSFKDRLKPTSSQETSITEVLSPIEDDVQEPTKTYVPCEKLKEVGDIFEFKLRDQNETKRTLDGSSSCDESTVIGSSSDEAPKEVRSSVSSLKSMLSEAINDHCSLEDSYGPQRDESPTIERAENAKVGSSGHTSADELETGTSSDIEIISSPNGDGSINGSRQSPAKLIYKSSNGKMSVIAVSDHLIPEISGKYVSFRMSGHNREPSETSSGCSDDCVEIDRLLRKIAELSEMLESRESKLVGLSMKHAELSENNSNLKSQIECQNEEFSQRFAALEKKFQQSIRERDSYRKQVEVYKQQSDFDEDKDEIIKELREEGEKLSKQQLSCNILIKKLRATEKDHLKLISSLREQYDGAMQELEKMKKNLNTKELAEKSQIERSNQLTKNNQRLEKQVSTIQLQVDSLTSTVVTLQKQLLEKDKALTDLRTTLSEATEAAKEEAVEKLKEQLDVEHKKQNELCKTLGEMRQTLHNRERQYNNRETLLRQENAQLLRYVEQLKLENENRIEEIVAATKPITKELQEEISKNYKAAELFDETEKSLRHTISELQEKLQNSATKENTYMKLYEEQSSEISILKSNIEKLRNESIYSKKQYHDCKMELDSLQMETKRLLEEHSRVSKSVESVNIATQTEVINNEQSEVGNLDGLLQEEQYRFNESAELSYPSSPTLSVRRLSLSESVISSAWPVFNDDEHGSSCSQIDSVYDGYSKPIATATSLLENLQSQIKQREGEIQQLQWELKRRDHERNMLTDEISKLTVKVDELQPYLDNFNILQRQYNELLQMYGEKAEAYKEMQMDLQDIKEIHKLQITQLLGKEE